MGRLGSSGNLKLCFILQVRTNNGQADGLVDDLCSGVLLFLRVAFEHWNWWACQVSVQRSADIRAALGTCALSLALTMPIVCIELHRQISEFLCPSLLLEFWEAYWLLQSFMSSNESILMTWSRCRFISFEQFALCSLVMSCAVLWCFVYLASCCCHKIWTAALLRTRWSLWLVHWKKALKPCEAKWRTVKRIDSDRPCKRWTSVNIELVCVWFAD